VVPKRGFTACHLAKSETKASCECNLRWNASKASQPHHSWRSWALVVSQIEVTERRILGLWRHGRRHRWRWRRPGRPGLVGISRPLTVGWNERYDLHTALLAVMFVCDERDVTKITQVATSISRSISRSMAERPRELGDFKRDGSLWD